MNTRQRGTAAGSERRAVRRAAAFLAVALVAVAGTATASHLTSGTDGHTTVDQTLVPVEAPGGGYTNLKLGPGEPYIVRDGAHESKPTIPDAQPGRSTRRRSLAYLSQMTDFQLADEESPARVEFVDPGPSSAWRPQEGFTPFQIEATVRQINRYAQASPVPQGDGTRNKMDFALLTGDQADNQHLNETVWVRDLLEGNGPLTFNSGLSMASDYASPASLGASCAAFFAQEGGSAESAAAEGARYTGVQDYDDYPASPPHTPLFYDPDEPRPPDWADWPEYDGLMDRAQQIAVDPEGLDVPFYITNGNHDVLVQGNEDAVAALEDIATGCFKALGTTNDPTQQPPGLDGPDPSLLLSPANVGMLVPPDPRRQFVSKPEIKDIYGATDEGPGDDDHGFSFVDPEENDESGGAASYYAWDPVQTPGMRFISIDTNSEGGQTAETFVPGQPSTPGSSNGNLDDPQFQWIKRELTAAKERDQLVVLFGHHPVRSMSTQIRDEQAVQCSPGPDDEHGHDPNPGCDHDTRPSDDDPDTPGFGCIHNGTDMQNSTCPQGHESFVELLDQFPNVVAYVPGHTHEHRLTPFVRTDGTTWWEINTSAVIDPPNQSRLIDLMENQDGTLSIFNTVVDHAAPATAPPDCPDGPTPQPDCAAGFDVDQLGSIGRTFAYNDPDNDHSGTGTAKERNAELLLEDPRPVADLSIAKADAPDPVRVGDELTYTLTVRNEGPNGAKGVTVTDELPAGAAAGAVTASQGTCERTGRSLRCTLGALAVGASATVSVVVFPETEGELVNRASVRGNVSDRNAANDAATATTTVVPRPAEETPRDGGGGTTQPPGGSPPGGPPGGGPPGGGPPGGGPPGGGPPPTVCANAAIFRSAAVSPRGRRVRVAFSGPSQATVRADVFQTSVRRRVISERLIARFDGRRESFTWNGKANRRGRKVTDGFYFVRLRISDAGGRTEVRRVALRRSRGRWSRRPAFDHGASCGLLALAKLERPVFGGRSNRPLLLAYRLTREATVTVEVLRGTRVVRRLRRASQSSGVTHRLRLRPRPRRRGDFRVRITASRPGERAARVLVSRRL